MGWAGGTEVFDGALRIFLPYIPEEDIDAVLIAWYDVVKDGDWDTESESDYYDMLRPALVKAGYIDDDDLYDD